MLIRKLRYWLARRVCRRYVRHYLSVVDTMGLEWILDSIDEDVDLSSHDFNHALAGAGIIDYAARTTGDRSSSRFSPQRHKLRTTTARLGVIQLAITACDTRHAIGLGCATLEHHNQPTAGERGMAHFKRIAARVRR